MQCEKVAIILDKCVNIFNIIATFFNKSQTNFLLNFFQTSSVFGVNPNNAILIFILSLNFKMEKVAKSCFKMTAMMTMKRNQDAHVNDGYSLVFLCHLF